MNFTTPFCVYGLVDPDSGRIRYIGKTNDIKRRFRVHINAAKNHAKYMVHHWIRSILDSGKSPHFRVLQLCFSPACALQAEVEWIARLKESGENLCNLTQGGEGKHHGSLSTSTKHSISRALMGHKVSNETRLALSRKYRIFSQEQIDEIRILKKNNSYSVLARKYNVSPITIFNAVKGNYYGELKPLIQ